MRAIFIIAIWFGLAYGFTEFVADRVQTSRGHSAPIDATQPPSTDAARARSIG